MNILAVDDEKMALAVLVDAIKKATPESTINQFRFVEEALAYAKENVIDVAFLDIRMKGHTGVEVALMLKKINPKINIVFATGYDEYRGEAFSMHASGYLTKPITPDAVKEELDNLRYNQDIKPINNRIVAKTFGNFDLFVDGKKVEFPRSLSREILAYLIDKRGAYVTRQELSLVLFEDEDYSRKTQDYISKIVKGLVSGLKDVGASEILLHTTNSYSVDMTKLYCDAEEYLKGNPEAINSFNGEYMSQYLWSEDSIDKFYKDYD